MGMKVIYYCFGGTHSSVLCAAIHLGIISDEYIPGYKELMDCPYFDKVPSSEAGILHLMGRDKMGNDIYVLGCRNCGSIVEKAIKEISHILGIDKDELMLIDTTPCLNVFLRTGGFLSRGLGLIRPGRVLLFYGCRLSFTRFSRLVQTVQRVQNNLDREGLNIG